MTMQTFTAGALAAAAALALAAGAAQAHPRLLSANPAANSKVAAPAAIKLGYSETLVGKFCRIGLTDAAGRKVALGPTTLGADRKALTAAVKAPLAPGAYKVSWSAVSTDTHRVSGSYGFTVSR